MIMEKGIKPVIASLPPLDYQRYFNWVTKPADVSKDGVLVKHKSGDNVVAQVTAAPFDRWVNDAQAPGAAGRRTGANVKVIQARTVWIPTLTVA